MVLMLYLDLGNQCGWNGDVDLNDGVLQQQYSRYIEQLDFIQGLGLRGNLQLLKVLLALHEKLEQT